MNKKNVAALIFIVTFCYMYLFTSGIPFFWDDHEFHQDFYERSFKDTVLSIFSFQESALDSSRPIYGLFFKLLFFFFKFNFEMYRLIKALIFAASICAAFVLSNRFISSTKLRLIFISVVTFNFPIYIHTLVFDEPFIIAELFKLMGIILFLKNFGNQETNIKNQILVFLFSILAIRTYNPASSVIILLFVFVLFFNFEKLKKYFILLVSLATISFPFARLASLNFSGPHGTNFGNLLNFFGDNSANYILSPSINFNNLYYKPAIAVLTFFGFFLIILLIIIFIKLYFSDVDCRKKMAEKKNEFLFLFIWFFAELPLLVSLPEHAVRYLSSFIIPFYLIVFLIFDVLKKKFNKKIFYLFVLLIIGIMLTNLAYISAFRIGWGSQFIANQKALDFIESQNKTNFTAIYYSQSAAYDFVPLYKNISDYKIKDLEKFSMTNNLSHFSEEYLKILPYEKVYIIQKISANGRSVLPPISLNYRKDLNESHSFVGIKNNLFDKFNLQLIGKFTNAKYSFVNVYLFSSIKKS